MPIKSTKNPKLMKAAKEQADVKSTISAPPLSTIELHSLISKRAYELFLQRGTNWGNDLEDWLLAEQEITAALQAATQTPIQTTVVEPTPVKPQPRKTTTGPSSVKVPAKRSGTTTRARKKPAPEI